MKEMNKKLKSMTKDINLQLDAALLSSSNFNPNPEKT